ncbi:ABC-three component system middle component 2 [Enterococcus durans]|mgnify:CR=1 FL=1|nr:ABC-three component system middle component 2 [Enterococcus durans]
MDGLVGFTKMNNLFNTPFEVSIRILLTLSIQSIPVSSDRILASDFITTYGHDFDIFPSNLNGDNSYHSSEFIARRALVNAAIKKLVLQRLIQPSQNEQGFMYSLSDEGKLLIPKFVSIYAEKYLEVAERAKHFLKDRTDKEALLLITEQDYLQKGE